MARYYYYLKLQSDSNEGSRSASSRQSFSSQINTSNNNWPKKREDDHDSGLSSNLSRLQANSQQISSSLECNCHHKDDGVKHEHSSSKPGNTTGQGLIVTEAIGPPERTFKVIFIGDASVGKSSFIWRLTNDTFAKQLGSTLGVDFQVKSLCVSGMNVALQLWDTAGQERFRSITKSYFRKADGIMLLYDVSNEHSFTNVRRWINDVEDLTSRTIPLIIIGNKTDLRQKASLDKQYFVSAESGEKFAKDNNSLFVETSVADGSGVHVAIGHLIMQMLENEDSMIKTSGIQLFEKKPSKIFGCCSK